MYYYDKSKNKVNKKSFKENFSLYGATETSENSSKGLLIGLGVGVGVLILVVVLYMLMSKKEAYPKLSMGRKRYGYKFLN